MSYTQAASTQAKQALDLVSELQQRFVSKLETLAATQQQAQTFTAVEWLRNQGKHGGGMRFETADGSMIGRGSVNVSQVHYDDDSSKALGSATAISTIIHPNNPHAPSVHIHISWTEMKSGQGYWRMMADLNPSIAKPQDTQQFLQALQGTAPTQFTDAKNQGEHYFFIPALDRHRGVAHFYLEAYNSGDATADITLAQQFGQAAIDTYLAILQQNLNSSPTITAQDKQAQLAYHSLYFFQVLTLDRGTTSGLLVHDQNDVGILGSLPAYVDADLLSSWLSQMQSPQDALLQALIHCLPHTSPCLVDAQVKAKLAATLRQHYLANPQAIDMQASGHVVPPTVRNHR
ncbi:MAG: coproporphyrinogen III oxidase [Mariprofundaceae bacterium]|nr:coproporphyrinogen III oxidase [Mariprofundaceae bacterium]